MRPKEELLAVEVDSPPPYGVQEGTRSPSEDLAHCPIYVWNTYVDDETMRNLALGSSWLRCCSRRGVVMRPKEELLAVEVDSPPPYGVQEGTRSPSEDLAHCPIYVWNTYVDDERCVI